jgi:hypothetical protein
MFQHQSLAAPTGTSNNWALHNHNSSENNPGTNANAQAITSPGTENNKRSLTTFTHGADSSSHLKVPRSGLDNGDHSDGGGSEASGGSGDTKNSHHGSSTSDQTGSDKSHSDDKSKKAQNAKPKEEDPWEEIRKDKKARLLAYQKEHEGEPGFAEYAQDDI